MILCAILALSRPALHASPSQEQQQWQAAGAEARRRLRMRWPEAQRSATTDSQGTLPTVDMAVCGVALVFQLTLSPGRGVLPVAQPPPGLLNPPYHRLPPPAHPRYLSPYSSSAVHVFDLIAAAASSSLGVGGARAGRDAAASGGSGAAAAGSMSGGAGADDKARAWHCAPDRLCLALQLMLRLLPELQLRQAAARLPGLWRLLVAVLLHAAATRSTLFVEHESLDVLSDAGVLLRLRVCAATDGAPPLAAADEPNQGRQDHHGEQGQQQEEHPKQQLQGQQGPGQGPGQGQAEQDVALDEANAPDEASVGDSNGGHNVGGCTSSLPGTSRSCSVSLNSSDYDEDLQTMQAQTDQPRQQQPAAAAAAADCSYSLRCALDAGLLPALEQLVRSAVGGWSTAAGATGTRLAAVAAAAGPAAATGPGGSPQLQPQLQPQGLHQRLAMGRVTMATHAVGSLLLTSGVFPAVLAHGCPMQVVPLLSTMAGVLRCLTAGDGRGGGTGGIGGSGTGGGSLGGLQLVRPPRPGFLVRTNFDGTVPAAYLWFLLMASLSRQLTAVMGAAAAARQRQSEELRNRHHHSSRNPGRSSGGAAEVDSASQLDAIICGWLRPVRIERAWLEEAGGAPASGSAPAMQQADMRCLMLQTWLPALVEAMPLLPDPTLDPGPTTSTAHGIRASTASSSSGKSSSSNPIGLSTEDQVELLGELVAQLLQVHYAYRWACEQLDNALAELSELEAEALPEELEELALLKEYTVTVEASRDSMRPIIGLRRSFHLCVNIIRLLHAASTAANTGIGTGGAAGMAAGAAGTAGPVAGAAATQGQAFRAEADVPCQHSAIEVVAEALLDLLEADVAVRVRMPRHLEHALWLPFMMMPAHAVATLERWGLQKLKRLLLHEFVLPGPDGHWCLSTIPATAPRPISDAEIAAATESMPLIVAIVEQKVDKAALWAEAGRFNQRLLLPAHQTTAQLLHMAAMPWAVRWLGAAAAADAVAGLEPPPAGAMGPQGVTPRASRVCANTACCNMDGVSALLQPGGRSKTCVRCSQVTYCCGACQLADWQEGGHNSVCRLLQQLPKDSRW